MPARSQKPRRILARAATENFVGRGRHLRELASLASPKAGPQSLVLLSAPQAGASELLRQAFDELFRQRGEVEFGPELAHAAVQSGVPFVLAGLRRRVLDILNGTASQVGLGGLRRLHLDRLKATDARAFTEGLAQQHGVELSEETRDLVVQQLESSPYLITALVEAARSREAALASFRDFQSLYVDELLGGRIHRRFAAVLEEVAPSLPLRRNLLRVLQESSSNLGGKSPAEVWMKRLSLDAMEFERVMRLLHMHELASFQATFVETTPSAVWRDYLRVSYRLHISVEPRALVVADTLVESLKRAPQTMARP